MAWKPRPACSHYGWFVLGPLWRFQRLSYPDQFPGVRRAVALSQLTHVGPWVRMRLCLACDELRRI